MASPNPNLQFSKGRLNALNPPPPDVEGAPVAPVADDPKAVIQAVREAKADPSLSEAECGLIKQSYSSALGKGGFLKLYVYPGDQ